MEVKDIFYCTPLSHMISAMVKLWSDFKNKNINQDFKYFQCNPGTLAMTFAEFDIGGNKYKSLFIEEWM